MCGIVAIINKKQYSLAKKETDIFEQLLYVGALRGWDSTGVFKVNYQEKTEIFKKACMSSNFFYYLEKEKNFTLTGSILVGHNRAATRGEVTDENAHPFKEEHITLVHNGTLFGHKNLADVAVDSHAICHYLADNTPQNAVDAITGAYALTWFDEKDKQLKVLRNEERPLTILHTEGFYVLVSEADMGKWILSRNGIKITKAESCKPFTLYYFKKDKGGWELHETNLREKKKQEGNIIPFTYSDNKEKVEALKERVAQLGALLNSFVSVEVLTAEKPKTTNGWYEHWGVLQGHDDIEVQFYHPTDVSDCIVELKYTNCYSHSAKHPYMFGTFSKVITYPDGKANGIKQSSNETVITPEVSLLLKKCKCTICTTPYDEKTVEQSVVTPLWSQGHVYGYRYVCPDCSQDYVLWGANL